MHSIRLITLAGSLLLSGFASAQVRVEGPVEYGIFNSEYQDFQPGERVLTHTNQTIETTTNIPAKLGMKFGMRYSLTGKIAKDQPLTLLYLTPGVTTPDGLRHDKFVVEQTLLANSPQDLMAFEFTENYEMVPGEWHFMVFQGDRLLAEQRFNVR
ncbi:MAG: DUF3859 domain-containing protein [Pseudomonas sp.]|uniref:DUF3859 domain-containing protein n=1 Tax=Pseudomonas sp. TaxID=306 RepID=UPI002732B2D3|nr:DUF3859 domain-containing protein [Pseudomonas sp.]MDP3848128.1 DUF3859 domain-containing protein [Pseudomonas sp.]